ncbi:hypothetical protein HW555_011232, partial [Spodoptera exigua]
GAFDFFQSCGRSLRGHGDRCDAGWLCGAVEACRSRRVGGRGRGAQRSRTQLQQREIINKEA